MSTIYQIQFINPKWGGRDFEIEDNLRVFKNYNDACIALDDIGNDIVRTLTDEGEHHECHEERDENTDLLSSIEFFTTSEAISLNYIVGNVVPIKVEVCSPPTQDEEEPKEKPYRVELWYNYYRDMRIMATNADDALDKAREMPLTPSNDNIQEVDCFVEEIK